MTSRVGAAEIAAALQLPAPTAEQVAVIEHPLTSMLVVAGAGSGKTETMAARVVWLVANGHVDPQDVLGLTFTRKASGELAERITRRLRHLARSGLWAPEDVPCAGRPEEPGEAFVLPATVSTYHAYAGRLVRDHGLLLGVEADSRLLTEAAAWQLAHEAVVTFDGALDELEAAESTVTAAVLALSAELCEHLRTVDEIDGVLERLREDIEGKPLGGRRRAIPAQVAMLLAHSRQQRAVLPLVRRYAELKRRRDCLDFADQMALAARLAVTCPDVARGERARHRLVLLDEFQDTSEAQLTLLHALFADDNAAGADADSVQRFAASRGAPVPVMAVGDPHQSIYGWRGASATTLVGFSKRFGGEGATPTLPLSTSWRNDAAVLAVANVVAEPLSNATTVPVARLVPAPGAARGQVAALRAITAADEAAAVAEWIGERWWADRESRRASGRSAAVLCRRRAQFPAIVEALRSAGLPVEVVGVGGLLLTPEVADLYALLAVACDPARGDMLMRLLTGPAVRLGAADLDALAAWTRHRYRPSQGMGAAGPQRRGGSGPARAMAGQGAAGDQGSDARSGDSADVLSKGAEAPPNRTEVHELPSIVEAIHRLPPEHWRGSHGEQLSPVGRSRLRDLADVVAQVRQHIGSPLVDVVGVAEQALGLDVEVLARPDVPWAAARVHLDAFLDVAADFEAAADRPTLDAFVAWLEVAKDQERGLEIPATHTNHEAVQVLTVHAAKGLEWDAVAVPGLVDTSFPSFRAGPTTARNGAWMSAQPRDRGWTVGLDRIPYALRGDRTGLPALEWATAPDLDTIERRLEDFAQAGGEHAIAEERRLAYVALTRARHDLLLTASVWTDASSPRISSRFLTEILDGAPNVEIHRWEPMPPADGTPLQNPVALTGGTASWPPAPVHARPPGSTRQASVQKPDPADRTARETVADLCALRAEADVLLAARDRERALHRDRAPGPPTHLSASELVRFASDPEAFLLDLRRPVPQQPSAAAKNGTLLHRWIEEYYSRASIVDLDELPGLIDDADDDDAALARRKERFLDSPWAGRVPVALELPIETVVDGVSMRGRIDAVFEEPDGRYVVVDWKNARPPGGAALRARSLQLAVYRLAYARLIGRRPEDVDAVFYFADTGETLRPELAGSLAGSVEGAIRAQVRSLRTKATRGSSITSPPSEPASAGPSSTEPASAGPQVHSARGRSEPVESDRGGEARPAPGERAPAGSGDVRASETSSTGSSVPAASGPCAPGSPSAPGTDEPAPS